jgi:hypothetical protein
MRTAIGGGTSQIRRPTIAQECASDRAQGAHEAQAGGLHRRDIDDADARRTVRPVAQYDLGRPSTFSAM